MDFDCKIPSHRRKSISSQYMYRIGPAPLDEVDLTIERKEGPKVKECIGDIGSLDGDLENMVAKERMSAASRTLLIYFAKMANATSKDELDYEFLTSLINNGAKLNVSDRFGQSIMHEVARNWSADVAKFLISYGADVNTPDEWGRTPLHLASAVNHSDMVNFLLYNGGNASARTNGEKQTPLHYAAKYNAVSSVKALIDFRVDFNCRDYKERTPLFLATDMAQEDTVRYLLDLGIPVGVFDDTGASAIALMIEKMPHVARDALNQFQTVDVAFRRRSFYLNYLESAPLVSGRRRRSTYTGGECDVGISVDHTKEECKQLKRLACPATALEIAVNHREDQVIMHPTMQQLIRTKWSLFGKMCAIMEFIIHLVFCVVWTALGVCLPRDGTYYEDRELYWRVPVEIFGVTLTLFFILKQIWVNKVSYNESKKFRLWRTRQLRRDLEFCHPRWSHEKTYIEHEMKNIRDTPSYSFLEDSWNILEFIAYASVLVAIVTRIVHVIEASNDDEERDAVVHERAYAFSLIFLWLHFMKSCRAFTTIGLFIALLEHVVKETMTFMLLIAQVAIPYMVGFWMLFGGREHAQTMEESGEDSEDWAQVQNNVYSVWQMMLVADFNFGAILVVDKLAAEVLVGSFYALCSMICINLHIALLTEKFREVYVNAKAHTSRLQATAVLHYEKLLTKRKMAEVREYLQKNCSPLIVSSEMDTSLDPLKELSNRMLRIIMSRLNRVKENFLRHIPFGKVHDYDKEEQLLYQGLLARGKELRVLLSDVCELKHVLSQLMNIDINKSSVPESSQYNSAILDRTPPAESAYQRANNLRTYNATANVSRMCGGELSASRNLIRNERDCSFRLNQSQYRPDQNVQQNARINESSQRFENEVVTNNQRQLITNKDHPLEESYPSRKIEGDQTISDNKPGIGTIYGRSNDKPSVVINPFQSRTDNEPIHMLSAPEKRYPYTKLTIDTIQLRRGSEPVVYQIEPTNQNERYSTSSHFRPINDRIQLRRGSEPTVNENRLKRSDNALFEKLMRKKAVRISVKHQNEERRLNNDDVMTVPGDVSPTSTYDEYEKDSDDTMDSTKKVRFTTPYGIPVPTVDKRLPTAFIVGKGYRRNPLVLGNNTATNIPHQVTYDDDDVFDGDSDDNGDDDDDFEIFDNVTSNI